MRILYFDCFSGISGDMTVGALRDLGVDEAVFHQALDSLGLSEEIHVHFQREVRQGISGWKFNVHSHGPAHDHSHPDTPHSHAPGEGAPGHGRNHREIRRLLEESSLSEAVKVRVAAIFGRIANAEGKIHGMPPEDVAFHEVGAVDSIADIVAACAGLESLGLSRIEASHLIEGTGWIDCAHGRFPLPAPATLEILTGIPLRQVQESTEFITPTGAAILAEYCNSFGPMQEMKIEKVGYGVGTRDTPPRPNVLRAVLGTAGEEESAETDEITQIETNLDDLSPELAGAAMQNLFAAGALDVFFTPVQMKKHRPGFILTVLCPKEKTQTLSRIILTETSAFGLRFHTVSRLKLRREFRNVETPYGTVRIKLGHLGSELVQAAPEFESCREAAEKAGVSVRDVYLAAWIGTPPKPE